ncbi:MAG: GlxA family transcriptional regulator [Povalibacter sp.]
MPSTKSQPSRIAVLLSENSSLALASLAREIFQRANRLIGEAHYEVHFVSAGKERTVALGGASLETRAVRGRYDYLIVTPLDGVSRDYLPGEPEVACVRSAHGKGTVVASACLGAMTLASAGLLDGREATTHWAWATTVRNRFPQVHWNPQRMLSRHDDVITAGGYLAVVDLVLHIVALTSAREIAHRLGQTLLADSVRQKQSVYAQHLIDPDVAQGPVREVAHWIENHLSSPLPARVLAQRSGMSLRSFHRKFLDAYGTTPRKFIQLKRIEKAQQLLRTTRRSLEQVLESVGVSDVASFRRIFQRELGYSPAEYRRKLRAV